MIPFTPVATPMIARCASRSLVDYDGARTNAQIAPRLMRAFSLFDGFNCLPGSSVVSCDASQQRRPSLPHLGNLAAADLESP